METSQGAIKTVRKGCTDTIKKNEFLVIVEEFVDSGALLLPTGLEG
jgi:hypothetical protein